MAFSKQYCLSDPAKRESELYCAGPVPLRRNVDARSGTSLKTIAPKLSVALIFLWLLSFYQEKESNIKLGEQNMNKEKNLFKRILPTEVR